MFLSCTALSGTVQSASAFPSSGQMTEKQLLQRITVLERDLEKEAQAIAALDERIAQLELKYLDVKSGIEHIAAVHTGQTGSRPIGQAGDIAVPAPDWNADELFAAGGFLMILLLFLAMWLYRRKRGQSDAAVDITDFTEMHNPIKRDQPSEKYLQSLQKLAALKKAAQSTEPNDESTIVIRQDSYKNQLPLKSENKVIADVRAFMKQAQPELAIRMLESLLTKNKDSEIGWQLLFKILHHQNKKSTFRKHALRFKRLKQFPETWKKIQSWGHALEPDEPLYMNAQERKRRFFSS
ncbi:MAG: hypothetical protein KIS65_08755 [Nitrosomonas sp.]|nr:hypothetical protein [Nitrosomonas sp.]